jgi:hypothetical protein
MPRVAARSMGRREQVDFLERREDVGRHADAREPVVDEARASGPAGRTQSNPGRRHSSS